MRRKVKAGLIEADHDECAIVVHYEIEATVLGEAGEAMVAERTENAKVIKLKTLTENSNLRRLAEDIVDKCKLIHESKLGRVEELLHELRAGRPRGATGKPSIDRGGQSRRNTSEMEGEAGGGASGARQDAPSLSRLEQYVEMMYDGTESATTATHQVLQLSRSPENLEPLIQNEALVGLLARLLKEEGRKSQDLAINVLYILFAFSSFTQFHPHLVSAAVGSQILSMIGLECKRHDIRERERAKEREAAAGGDRAADKDKEKRHKMQVRKQEKLLYVCFHVLLNLAEEAEIERKMGKKGIVGLLTAMLERDNPELRVLALVFLKKLSIFKENLPALRDKRLVSALASCLSHPMADVLATALRLVYNLSFDVGSRAAMFASPLLSKLVGLLRRRSHTTLLLRILYNLSVEERGRASLAKTEVPAYLMKQILACKEPHLPADLAGLCINLAHVPAAAAALAADGGVRQLIDRLMRTRDVLLLKLIRAAVAHEETAMQAAPMAGDLLSLLALGDSEPMLLELLGTLSNLRLHRAPDLLQLVDRHGLVELILTHMARGATSDDVLLELVVLSGELAASEPCARLLLQSGVVLGGKSSGSSPGGARTLYSLMTERQDDDEFVLQLLYAFYRLLQVPAPRDALLHQTEIVLYLLDLFHDQNGAIRLWASKCLDAVAEADEDWAAQIRQRKFAMHNHEWLEVVDEDEAEEYQDALALSNAVHSLHVDGPLDAAHLEHSPGSHDPYADSADEDLSDSMADFNGYDRAHSPMAAYGGSALAHDGYKGYDEDYLQQQLMMARAAGGFAVGGYEDGEDEDGEAFGSWGLR